LIAVLPFLAVPLALVYRRYPGPTGALALVSFLMMLGPTSTRPQAGWDGHVIDRLTSKSLEGYGDTVTTFVGVTGPARIGPVILVVGAAIVAGVASAHPRKPTARDVTLAVSAVLAWGVGWIVIPTVLRASRVSDDVSAVLGFTVAALIVSAFCLLHKRVSHARLGVRA
jgi:hypothetical protein